MRARLVHILCLGILTLISSCYVEEVYEDELISEITYETENYLQAFDLWYIDIDATTGSGEVPFLQRAFTISFINGTIFTNTNLVGIGKNGNGYGIDAGLYAPYEDQVDIDHDLDGVWTLQVNRIDYNTLALVHLPTNTTYYLKGFNKSAFDYQQLVYDNIHYFLEEYDVWEKQFVSSEGASNEFDNENYLQFYVEDSFFRSSLDPNSKDISDIIWDYEGSYEIFDVANQQYAKILTLDYDYLGNDYFELYVIDDSLIELYHVQSGTTYQFQGKGFIEYLKSANPMGKKRIKMQKEIKSLSLFRDRKSKEKT